MNEYTYADNTPEMEIAASHIVYLLEKGIITKDEARKLLALPKATPNS